MDSRVRGNNGLNNISLYVRDELIWVIVRWIDQLILMTQAQLTERVSSVWVNAARRLSAAGTCEDYGLRI